jgi:hypothetical protein
MRTILLAAAPAAAVKGAFADTLCAAGCPGAQRLGQAGSAIKS